MCFPTTTIVMDFGMERTLSVTETRKTKERKDIRIQDTYISSGDGDILLLHFAQYNMQ